MPRVRPPEERAGPHRRSSPIELRPHEHATPVRTSHSISSTSEELMQTRGEFSVSVTKDYLVFASAHFITFAGHRCEGLHGHNYRARVTLEGALDEETWFVFDFVTLKHMMKRLCDEIDHKVLLPLENPKVQVAEEGDA